MRSSSFAVLLGLVLLSCPSPAAPSTPEKHTYDVLQDLRLTDAAAEQQVRTILIEHLAALGGWHQQHDAELKSLWAQFDQARTAKDKAAATAALARIDAVYASFRPQHDKLLSRLSPVLTPAQVERVQDVLTVDKVRVTYQAYLEIFPLLTEAQKTVVLQELKAARAEAIDAGTMEEKSAFFKKHKIRIEEDYFPTQGIDAQKFRQDFAAKTKARNPAAAATSSDSNLPAASPAPHLWFAQPAAKWEEALPVGSGRLGAMVFGGKEDERIQFNEDTLWAGRPHDYVRAGSGDALPEVRRLLAAGDVKAAETLARAKVLSDPVRQKPYQPFGDLHLHFPGHAAARAYVRTLDLDTALAVTRYEVDGVTFTRTVFASYPDHALVVRLEASQPGALAFSLKLDSPHKESRTELLTKTDGLKIAGRVQADGLAFEARVLLRHEGGTVSAADGTLSVEKATTATLVLVAATSFNTWEDIAADPAARCTDDLARLAARPYAELRTRHVADHQPLFRRVSIDLGHSREATLATDERVRRAKAAGSIDADPDLAALEFQYGRYLLIASSRPGSQPANLQGVWNELLNPPWESKYTTNINFEMNYWLAETTGLGECHEPFFAAIDDLRISGARTAQKLYGARGWVLHHNFDLWRGTAPINNIDGIWPTGGAWLCWHLWERYLFTGDRAFLAQRAYPAMKEAALFFIDSLIPDPQRGWLVTSPSFSPEQGTMTIGPAMDTQLIRALWRTTRDAARLLKTDDAFAAELDAKLRQLPPDLIGRHGQLQEWLADADVPDNNHRHMSPLWALYPGDDFTPANAPVFAAAKKLLAWRGDGSTGWSYAWRIPLWARVGGGDMAYRQLSLLLAKRTLPNLFDLCGPFQIDGNFGATAGIVEMLLQSHERTADGTVILALLPALPKVWPAGSVTGLRARDGFTVDLAWAEGKVTRATIHSTLGHPAQVRLNGTLAPFTLAAGATRTLTP